MTQIIFPGQDEIKVRLNNRALLPKISSVFIPISTFQLPGRDLILYYREQKPISITQKRLGTLDWLLYYREQKPIPGVLGDEVESHLKSVLSNPNVSMSDLEYMLLKTMHLTQNRTWKLNKQLNQSILNKMSHKIIKFRITKRKFLLVIDQVDTCFITKVV